MFIVLAVAIGIIAFAVQKPEQNEDSTAEPLTLDEAQALEIDTSDWEAFQSEDGVLTFKHPERELNVYEVKKELGFFDQISENVTDHATYMVQGDGKFFPEELIGSNESVPNVLDPGGTLLVAVFDDGLTREELVNSIQNDYRTDVAPFESKTSFLTIGGKEYQVVELAGTVHEVGSVHLIHENEDGELILVQAFSGSWGELDSATVLAVAKRIVEEIAQSVELAQ